MLPIFLPNWTWTAPQLVTALFLPAIPLFFVLEATGWLSFGYSKFADGDGAFTLPSRTGMLAIYAPAALTGPAVAAFLGWPDAAWHQVVIALVTLHFTKRCLETLAVHRYSGVTNAGSVLAISALYTTLAWLLVATALTEVPGPRTESPAFTRWLVPGLTLWVVGQVGNAVHHVILARLRAPGETGYKLPTAGLFRWVACPHYLFEIIGWIGVAVLFRHVTAWVAMATMAAYLAGRSHSTLRWYRDNLGSQVPPGWRRLVPFVF